MRTEKEKPPYLPKVAYVRLHTGGKTAKDYRQALKGQGFNFNQFKHMAKSDEYFDGLELWVSMWNYDNHESWHLWNWKKEDDSRVMMALYEAEQFNPYRQYINDFEGFREDWKAGKYDPCCTFTFPLEAVEVIEVVQEEEDNTDHDKARKAAAAAKEEVFLQRCKAGTAKKQHRRKKRRQKQRMWKK